MRSMLDKIKGAINETVGRAKLNSSDTTLHEEGSAQQLQGKKQRADDPAPKGSSES